MSPGPPAVLRDLAWLGGCGVWVGVCAAGALATTELVAQGYLRPLDAHNTAAVVGDALGWAAVLPVTVALVAWAGWVAMAWLQPMEHREAVAGIFARARWPFAAVLAVAFVLEGASGHRLFGPARVALLGSGWYTILAAWSVLAAAGLGAALRPPSLAAVLAPWLGSAVVLGLGLGVPLAIAPAAPAGVPNLVLIDIDTLRTDRTSLAGADPGRPLTPHLAALADRGITWSRAVSQAPWTLPANASLLTGLYPHEHGANSLEGWLAAPHLTLSELLRGMGWATAGVVSHAYVATPVGFSQGFDHFDDSLARTDSEAGSTAAQVTDRAIDWLRGRDGGQPFFLFAQYFDPHYEYLDHPEYPWADAYRGWLSHSPRDIDTLRASRHRMTPADIDHLVDRYDEEIAHTDAHVGRLLRHLDESGHSEDSVLVVVSDHGEEFMERGWIGHTISVHREVVHVPMVLVAPGVAPGVVNHDVVETRGLFWTVLSLLGVEHPGRQAGAPLSLEASEGGRGAAYSLAWLGAAPVRSGKACERASLRTPRWTYIHDLGRGSESLYEAEADPFEFSDVSAAHPVELGELRGAVDRWLILGTAFGAGPGSVDPEHVQALEALGYL